MDWQEAWFWAIRVLVSAALTPLILWLGRRWPIERHSWPRRAPLHVLFSVAFALARAACEIAVHLTLGASIMAANWMDSLSEAAAVVLIFGFHEGVMAYCIILTVQAVFRYHEKFQERARHALKLQLHASELRARIVQAQLGALKMQLQPHFLFNTLNAVVGLIRRQKGLQAEEALTRFSDLLRAVLDDQDAQEVSLSRELEYVRLYLSVEQMRFSDRLRVNISGDAETLSAAVPHLGLQPLVENAVRHGVALRAAGGSIDVRAVRRGEQLHISIQNDGAEEPRCAHAAGHGIGLANLRARLYQLYEDAAALHTDFRSDGRNTVTMILPFRTIADKAEATLALESLADG